MTPDASVTFVGKATILLRLGAFTLLIRTRVNRRSTGIRTSPSIKEIPCPPVAAHDLTGATGWPEFPDAADTVGIRTENLDNAGVAMLGHCPPDRAVLRRPDRCRAVARTAVSASDSRAYDAHV
jgi:hypothetical protein